MVIFKIKLKMNWPKTLNYAIVVVHSLSHVQLFATHELQNTRLPCSSLSPSVFSKCALSQHCHATISSFVAPFSSCRQSFPASWSFPVSQLFASGGQSVGASASASVFPTTGLISLLSKGLSRVFSKITVWKHQFFGALPSLQSSCHNHTWPWRRPLSWPFGSLLSEKCLCF